MIYRIYYLKIRRGAFTCFTLQALKTPSPKIKKEIIGGCYFPILAPAGPYPNLFPKPKGQI